MNNLEQYRLEIDKTDEQLVALFKSRMDLVGKVAEYKIRSGREVLDRKREEQKLQALTEGETSEFLSMGIRELFEQIMAISRKRQYQLLTENGVSLPMDYALTEKLYFHHARVVFQGVHGAYSDEAMQAFFDDSIESSHVETWREAMEAVSGDEADFAVLPIENSTAGIVSDMYDLLLEYENYIVGEQIIPIEHVLMSVPGATPETIRTVYSHPQGLAQCREYLDRHPSWKRRELLNTAVAAEKVSADGRTDQAAIASKAAASLYGLQILDRDLTAKKNATRFIIVSHNKMFVKNARKISICFGLPHACGTLYNMLGHFIFNGLNMVKIESRPIPEEPFRYRFFIDFEGNLSDPAVRNALRGIGEEAEGLRLLGNY